MQFKVPQFLEIEDKIFGPFTFRQFVYLVGGAGICFILYKLLGFVWGAIPIILIGSFSGALTFYRPNNKPFIYMLEAGFKFFVQHKLYIWKKETFASKKEIAKKNQGARETEEFAARQREKDMSRLSGSKLRDLAWSLDVLDLSKEKTSR